MQYLATLDLSHPQYTVFDVVQDDVNSRQAVLTLTVDGVQYNYATDLGGSAYTAGVNYIKSDGTRGSYTRLPDHSDAVTITTDGVMTVNFAPQMLTAAGVVTFNVWVQVIATQAKIQTYPLRLQVHPSAVPDGVPSTDYYNLHTLVDIQQMVEELEDKVNNVSDNLDVLDASVVKSINGRTSTDGEITLRAKDVLYTSRSPIYYDSPVESVMGALSYIEEAIEKIARITGVVIGD